MKILAVSGSARKGGNTEILIREALRGAGADGVEINILPDMDVRGCRGCRACRSEKGKGCKVKDEMQGLYKEIKEADALVLGSPIYYGELTGQMKCFMDRWYALRDKDRNLRIASGKKVLFIITQGADGEDRYKAAAERVTKVLKSYEMQPVVIVAPGVEAKGEVREKAGLMEKAFAAGRTLA